MKRPLMPQERKRKTSLSTTEEHASSFRLGFKIELFNENAIPLNLSVSCSIVYTNFVKQFVEFVIIVEEKSCSRMLITFR